MPPQEKTGICNPVRPKRRYFIVGGRASPRAGPEAREDARPPGSLVLSLGTRMKFGVDVAEAVRRDMRVNFGGVDAGVAKEFLDDSEVGAIFEQVRGEAVAEHVRRNVALDPGEANALLDPQP